jgi:hypothetical protein
VHDEGAVPAALKALEYAESTKPQNYEGHTGEDSQDWCYGCGVAQETAGECGQNVTRWVPSRDVLSTDLVETQVLLLSTDLVETQVLLLSTDLVETQVLLLSTDLVETQVLLVVADIDTSVVSCS